jgi:hypothetical protein
MTLKTLSSYGKGFQLKVLGALLTDRGFLLNVSDLLIQVTLIQMPISGL